ncbi:hypothetical protein ACVIQS_008587 [Bradyrhizobium diazoefficiens]
MPLPTPAPWGAPAALCLPGARPHRDDGVDARPDYARRLHGARAAAQARQHDGALVPGRRVAGLPAPLSLLACHRDTPATASDGGRRDRLSLHAAGGGLARRGRIVPAVSEPDPRPHRCGKNRRPCHRSTRAADRRLDLHLQRGTIHPRAHDHRRDRYGVRQLSRLGARRRKAPLAAAPRERTGLPLSRAARQPPRQGRQHQPCAQARRRPAGTTGFRGHSRRGLRAAARLPRAHYLPHGRRFGRRGADAAALHQSRPDPDQPRCNRCMARRAALLLRHPSAGEGRLGRRLLLRHLIAHSLRRAGADRRLSNRLRHGRLPRHPSPEGARLQHHLSQRTIDDRTRARGAEGIHHPACALVPRPDANRARPQRTVLAGLEAVLYRPALVGRCLHELVCGLHVEGRGT